MFQRSVLTAIALLAVFPSFAFGKNPVKLADAARFDLFASAAVGSINGGVVTKGDGSLQRMNWIAAGDQPRSYTGEFSVVHFGWSEIEVQFLPAQSGTVDVTLMGPWEQSPPGGPIFRQEVLWDDLSSSGATLLNASFEQVTAGLPDDWFRPYGDAAVEAGPVTPHDGTNYLRTWHDGQLRQTIAVTGGQVVTLRFFSRAQIPSGFMDMAPVTDPNSPAHQTRLRFMRGANLGNYLEAPAGQNWGQTYDATDFEKIRAEGFDHVRIPARWNEHTGPAPDHVIDESFAQQVDALLDHAANEGLAAIVNIHHFDAFTTDPAAETAKFYKLWEQIAARYSARPDTVAFELLNEPKDAATTEVMNPIYAEAISRIRTTNPDRTIFVGPGSFNSISELPSLHLPDDDTNLIVTAHSYAPFLFTHQGASWTGDQTTTTGLVFPGPPEMPLQPAAPASGISWVVDWIDRYNTLPTAKNPCSRLAFEPALDLAQMWSNYYGRPVHVGEFGCHQVADPDSRARFYRTMREVMDERGLGWAVWDWKAGFRYWDASEGMPAPGMREALFSLGDFGMPEMGRVLMKSAVGKSFRIGRPEDLRTWDELTLATFSTPTLDFTDPNPPVKRGIYRADWLK